MDDDKDRVLTHAAAQRTSMAKSGYAGGLDEALDEGGAFVGDFAQGVPRPRMMISSVIPMLYLAWML